MLILTRRVGESIVVGSDVMVTVLSVRGNQIKLGIKAPTDLKVDRMEVYGQVADQERQNSTTKDASPP